MTAKIAVLAMFAALCTAYAPPPAMAQLVSSKLGSIQPYTGMYYDANQSGSGLTVDLGPDNLLFMVFETYDFNGNQVNYITQPNFIPSSEGALQATGAIGSAVGSFYQVTNGQCPGCPYRKPQATMTSLAATFVWSSPRHVTMTFGTYSYQLAAANYEGKNDEEFLPGTWALSFLNDNSVYPGQGPQYQTTLPTEVTIVKIAPANFAALSISLDPGSSADISLPPAGAHLYTLACAGDQDGADDAACNAVELIWTNAVAGSQHQAIPRGTAKALIWYDPATTRSGLDIYQQTTAGNVVIGPANFHGEVYIEPNLLQTHLKGEGPAHVAAVSDGVVGIALTFTRLPATAVRDCYDYVSTNACQ